MANLPPVHRLRGMVNDQLGGETMTAAYSHGNYGWNQQLRAAVFLLHNALLFYGRSSNESTSVVKVVNAWIGEGKGLWTSLELSSR